MTQTYYYVFLDDQVSSFVLGNTSLRVLIKREKKKRVLKNKQKKTKKTPKKQTHIFVGALT